MKELEEIRAGSYTPLKELYRTARYEFISLALGKFPKTREDEAEDAFQDAIVITYDKILKRELTTLTSTLKTYVFSVGLNRVRNEVSKRSNQHLILSTLHANQKDQTPDDADARREELIRKLMGHLDQLNEGDRKVLELYYLQGYSMESIASEMGLANANVAKKKKHFALKKLHRTAKNLLNE